MSAIIRDEFRVTTLKNFINSLASNSLYLGIGRPQYWDTTGNIDTTVPFPDNTISGVDSDWADMTALKKLNVSDASTGIFKELWQANTIYDTYRHDYNGTFPTEYNGQNSAPSLPASLADVKFYVINSSYNIYVCLKHPEVNGVATPSIYSPETGVAIGTNTGIIKTADNYYWKFMGSTSTSDYIKFSSSTYHPVTTILSAPSISDPYYAQYQNQIFSASFKGGIYVINILTQGTGYNGGISGTRSVTSASTDSQFKVVGDGVGLQYTVTYGAGGSIVDIEVTNPGSGYTHATITATGGSNATFEILFTSMSGLGCDPVKDLVSRFLLLDTTLVGFEGNVFSVNNEYRKMCLVFNPYSYGTTSIASASYLDATITLNLGTGLTSAMYPVDAIVTGATSGARGRVLDFNTTTGALRLIRTSSENLNRVGAANSFQVAEAVTSNPGTGSAAIVSITSPQIAPYSGTLLYSEYRAPVMRNSVQSEDLKITVKF